MALLLVESRLNQTGSPSIHPSSFKFQKKNSSTNSQSMFFFSCIFFGLVLSVLLSHTIYIAWYDHRHLLLCGCCSEKLVSRRRRRKIDIPLETARTTLKQPNSNLTEQQNNKTYTERNFAFSLNAFKRKLL